MGQGLRVVKEHAWLAHDALHKDDTATAHAELHRALGISQDDEGMVSATKPATGSMQRFDAEFRTLCLAHGVHAAYVAVEPTGRALTGGDADVCAEVDRRLRASS